MLSVKLSQYGTHRAFGIRIRCRERQTFSRRPDTFYAPGEILLLDRNGRLIVRNDIDDETAYRHANFVSNANLEAMGELDEPEEDDDEDSKGGKNDGPSFGKG